MVDAGLEPATVPYQETALQVYKTCPLTIKLIHRPKNCQITYLLNLLSILFVIRFEIISDTTFVSILKHQPIKIPNNKCFIKSGGPKECCHPDSALTGPRFTVNL